MGYGTEMFTYSLVLVFFNRVAAGCFGLFMIWQKGEPYKNQAALWRYAAVSVGNVTATYCQYEALKYVSFPVQMLGKSFKMCPVMLVDGDRGEELPAQGLADHGAGDRGGGLVFDDGQHQGETLDAVLDLRTAADGGIPAVRRLHVHVPGEAVQGLQDEQGQSDS